MESSTPKPKKKSQVWIPIAVILLLLVAVVLLILFLTRGTTTVSGGWTESQDTDSLICEANNISYPIFNNEDTKGNLKINAIFGDKGISSISLIFRAQYESEDARSAGRVNSRIAMEKAFSGSGLDVEALGVNYSSLEDNIFQMSLYATSGDLNNSAYKYFMLDPITSGNQYTINAAQKVYKEKGLSCKTRE